MSAHMSNEVLYGLLAGCVMASFFVGHAMDGVMGRAGFGVLGNMLVLITGLFIGIFAADLLNLRTTHMEVLGGAAIIGSFSALMLLAILKHCFLRVD